MLNGQHMRREWGSGWGIREKGETRDETASADESVLLPVSTSTCQLDGRPCPPLSGRAVSGGGATRPQWQRQAVLDVREKHQRQCRSDPHASCPGNSHLIAITRGNPTPVFLSTCLTSSLFSCLALAISQEQEIIMNFHYKETLRIVAVVMREICLNVVFR